MKISVALALYNSNEYLLEQLDSLRTQYRKPDEVILVDDASTNDTIQMVTDYIQKHDLKHWHLSVHDQNQGFIQTFRDALQKCRGDVIFLCDHDDIWMPEKIQIMADVFEKNPKVQALASSFIPVNAQNKPMETKAQKGKANNNLIRKPVQPHGLTPVTFEDLAAYNISPGCTAALTRELAQKYMEFQGSLPHDWAVYAIAALQNSLWYLDRPLMRYRLHDHNTLGLKRQTAWQKRSDNAQVVAAEKDALMALCRQFGNEQNMSYMEKVQKIYSTRAKMIKNRNIPGLILLMAKSMPIPFVYETLAADVLAALRSFV